MRHHNEKTAAAKADRMLVTLHVNSKRVKRQDHGIESIGRSCKRTRDNTKSVALGK